MMMCCACVVKDEERPDRDGRWLEMHFYATRA